MSVNIYAGGSNSLTGSYASAAAFFSAVTQVKGAILTGKRREQALVFIDVSGQTAADNVLVIQGAASLEGPWVELARITMTAAGAYQGAQPMYGATYMRAGWAKHTGTTTKVTVMFDHPADTLP